MMTEIVNSVLRHVGYQVYRVRPRSPSKGSGVVAEYPSIEPIWPLPRRSGGLCDEDIRREFAKHDFWHYAYQFEGDLSFEVRHSKPSKADIPERHLQRFRHFMPYLLGAHNGSLQGKRVLDIACNSGFWSMQCALLGAEVVGFDARPELIDQANLIKSIVGVDNAEFHLLDFWDMCPEVLGGTFDIVLNLGILFHLPDPLAALKMTQSMSHDHILLDTTLHPMADPVVTLSWQEPVDIRSTATAGIVAASSKSAIELMLKHIGVADWCEIPVRTADLPLDYLIDRRASWHVRV